MKTQLNMNDQFRMHILGLQRLAINNPKQADQNTKKLVSDIINLCKTSELPYEDIQKAIVLADNSLYKDKTSTGNSD